jgi:hypothetical protein
MCEELYNECIPCDNLTLNNIPILCNNSHALNLFLQSKKSKKYNTLKTIIISNATNYNCLNRMALYVIPPYERVEGYGGSDDIIYEITEQFCKVNNISKPYITKKLISGAMRLQSRHDDEMFLSDEFLKICIENKSYDIAKYIIKYHHWYSNIQKLILYYKNDINLVIEHIKFLIEYSAINVARYHNYLHKCPDFEYKGQLLKFVSAYIKQDVLDILKS